MNCKQLQLRTENKRLGRAWLAGAKPGEFLRLMKEPEIEILSVPLLWYVFLFFKLFFFLQKDNFILNIFHIN